MRAIQFILVVLLFSGLLFYIRYFRSRRNDRIVVFGIVTVAVVAVAVPELTSVVASWVGVGRGVDLIVYLALVGFLFLWLATQSEVRVVESRQTEIVRLLAIERARLVPRTLLERSGHAVMRTRPPAGDQSAHPHDDGE